MSSIVQRLRKVRWQEQIWHLLRGIGMLAVVSTSVLLLCICAEAVAHGSIGMRTTLVLAWLAATVASLVVFTGKPLLRLLGLLPGASITDIALRVGDMYGDLRDTLANALQLEQQPNGSNDLASAAMHIATQAAQSKDFSVIINKKRPRFAMLLAVFSTALVSLLPLLFPASLGQAFSRLANFERSYMPPAPFTISIKAKADTVMRGANAGVEVRVRGVMPEHVTMFVKEEGTERFTPVPVVFDSGMVTVHQFPGISNTVSLYVASPWNDVVVASDTLTITVIDRPLIRSLAGRVIPPAYTRQPPTVFNEQSADVTALRGSSVTLNVTSNKNLSSASIVIETSHDTASKDTTIVPMDVKGALAVGSFEVKLPGKYHVVLVDADQQTNANPVSYNIAVLTDAFPTIAMVQPRQDVDVDASARLPLLVAIADDYGFSTLKLKYKLVKSKYSRPDVEYHSIALALQAGAMSLDVGYTWNLADVDITPDDVYEFYVEVADNDIVGGPKTARTGTYKVRMPSLSEVFAETDRTQESLAKDLKEIAKEAEQLRRESEELQREMQKQQSQLKTQTQWSEKKKADDLAKRQQELERKMDQAAEKLEQMTQKLEQHQAISEETLQKYKELQELMRTVKSPELERMQKQMQEAMKQISPEEMEKMMQNFKFDEEKFKQNIERTMNLLKRVQAEQKADELAKRAEDLAEKQEALRKETENTNANNKEATEQLTKKQEQLQEELQKLAKESKELEQLMKDLGANMPMDKMEQAMQELDEQQTQSAMQQAEQQMNNADMKQASQKQKQASENLQRFAQQMQQVKKQMNRNANKEAMRQMQKGMNDMVDLSKQQEELMQQMQSADPNSQQFSQMSQRQQQIQEAMKNMANNMMQLGQKSMSVSPEMAQDMGDALQRMQSALNQMQERNGSMAQRDQQGAMSSMNSAAKRMSEALGQMMQGEGTGQGGEGDNPGQGKGSGQSPFQRLQQLANQQQQINQQMGQMGQNPGSQGQGAGANGGQLTQEQRAEMGRLAQQQGKALKALQELEQESHDRSGSKKPIGDLNQIAADMKEVMTDMQTGSITPETRLRQERILSRLLNASRSMNERDYEKTRESNSGVDVERQSPSALNKQLNDPSAMRSLMEQLRRGYSKDYENLIRMYFEALQKRRIGAAN